MNYLWIIVVTIFLIGCDKFPTSKLINSLTSDKDITSDETSSQNPSSSNPLFSEQWTINKDTSFYSKNSINENAHVNMLEASKNYTGKNIKVAVIDNGFDISHPEIKDKIIATSSIDTNGTILGSDVSHKNTSDNHGTAVAGIIASNDDKIGIRGVSPDVELILIKLPTYLSDATVITAFNEAIKYGADVINCSWGTGSVSDAIRSYLNNLATTARSGKGITIIFASGNDNINIKDDESSVKNIIATGATDKENLRTTYSNYGESLDIVAPGGQTLGVTTLDPIGLPGKSADEYNRYDQYTSGKKVAFIGTSAAAPILTGIIALGLQKNVGLDFLNIKKILKYSTDTIGENTPYLDDMIISSTTTPVITGKLGSSGNDKVKVKLISNSSSTVYGPYSITTINTDKTFSATITSALPQGEYTIKLVDTDDTVVFSTDEEFEINSSKTTLFDTSIKKSDYYGYGKINVEKFINNID